MIALLFCFVRPYNTVVYAPKLKHADAKHAPPVLGKGPFAWIKPVWKTTEEELAEKIGLDATLFLRFTRMCRNMFIVLTIVGCAIIIPVNFVGGKQTADAFSSKISTVYRLTPQYMFGAPFWGFVAIGYVITAVVCPFLWWNYRAVARLRRKYFDGSEYQNSLHSRTILVTDIPQNMRNDDGVVNLVDSIKATSSLPRTAIARNVKEIPEKIEEHEKAVRQLEKVLAKYLKNPDRLPATRPLCKPSKKDKTQPHNQKVDAIDYLTNRIEILESEIRMQRESVDNRNPMAYGFASYKTIDEAHSLAYAAKGKKPNGARLRLSPKPSDLLWKNLGMTPSLRRYRRIINNLWVALLTVAWIVPNALIAVFLTDLSKLGRVWPAFQTELEAHQNGWAAVQGVLAPALTSLFYFFLPSIFRKLSARAGDVSKTSRERHVIHKLYAFFVFNNLVVFSFFSSVWGLVTFLVNKRKKDHMSWGDALEEAEPLRKIMDTFSTVSPFWVNWLLQRNLGAAIDLSQIVNLAWGSMVRRFRHPTPRELIESTAPPPFDYASYYNYFLFYTTVALCFAAFQPIVLPVTCLYFTIDFILKKYLLMYVFVTKTESGGQYWRILFNRFIFALLLANTFIALMVAAKAGEFLVWKMLAAMAPLPFIIIGFKFYCHRAFDDQIYWYTKGEKKDKEANALPDKSSRDRDRVAVRFGHPALYKKLMKPMVHEKARHMLAQIYGGRLNSEIDDSNTGGYSDSVNMNRMSKTKPGKISDNHPFELVNESQLDFEHFKNRADFREEHGGEGEMYGRPSDMIRPGTPGRMYSDSSAASHARSASAGSNMSDRTFTPDRVRTPGEDLPGTTYPAGYHITPAMRGASPGPGGRGAWGDSTTGLQGGRSTTTLNSQYSESYEMLRGAATMGTQTPGGTTRPYTPTHMTPENEGGYDYFRGRHR